MMAEHKFIDPGEIDISILAEKIAAAVLIRRHDFMKWPSEGQPATLDDEKLVQVIEDEVMIGLTSAN